jgi:outer membrane immunogenic protein
MKRYLSLVAAIAAATPAAAQEFPGFRIEANIGWDHVNATLDYEDSDFPEDNFRESGNTDGMLLGGTIGYDLPVGPVYLGIEGSFDIPINKRCETLYGYDEACFKPHANLAVGGRIGVPLSKRALLYAGAAYVTGKAEVTYEDEIDPSYDFSYDDWRDGMRFSGGAEVRLIDNWFTKVEYRYTDYDDYKYAFDSERVSLGFERHQIVTGIGVRY